jgi:hypothetical protein
MVVETQKQPRFSPLRLPRVVLFFDESDQSSAMRAEFWQKRPTAADLTFLQQSQQALSGTSNRKAALES